MAETLRSSGGLAPLDDVYGSQYATNPSPSSAPDALPKPRDPLMASGQSLVRSSSHCTEVKPRAQRIHEPTDENENWRSCHLLRAGCLPSLSSTGSGLVFRSHVAVRWLEHVIWTETAGKPPLIPKP